MGKRVLEGLHMLGPKGRLPLLDYIHKARSPPLKCLTVLSVAPYKIYYSSLSCRTTNINKICGPPAMPALLALPIRIL